MARTAEVVRALKATARTLSEDTAFDANPIGIDADLVIYVGEASRSLRDDLSGHWQNAPILVEADRLSPLLGFEP
jgi:hypothetical protein